MDIPSKEEIVVHRLPIYVFLQKFYKGEFNHLSSEVWNDLVNAISQEVSSFTNEKMNAALDYFYHFTDCHLEEFEFDFNKLFVGPNRLEASPYESSYRNKNGAVLQGETLAVRRFYETAGLVLKKKNIEPEDHIAFELEFICYLLDKSLINDDCFYLYREFLKQHMFPWVEHHCELVREKTKNHLIIGISYLLQGLMEEEMKLWNTQVKEA